MLTSSTAAWAQPPAATSLPVGTPLTIVADETVGPRVRPGSEFRAHLRDPIELGSTLIATAGTTARLVIMAKENAQDGTPRYHIAVIGLRLGLAGTLPVKPDSAIVDAVMSGMPIAVTTLAAIDYDAGKIRVAIPLPLNLSNEAPNGGFTAAPLRTAAPILPRRKPSPRPTPVPSPAASPTTGADPNPTSPAGPVAVPTSTSSPIAQRT